MRHLDLFSGIGGFALAAQWIWGEEYETIAFCDNDEFCQRVLQKNFPATPIFGDIRTLSADTGVHEQRGLSPIQRQAISSAREGGIDLLTDGFPCQPFSSAGRGKGTEDDRHLWPEMLRVIREFRPRWVVGENVAGLVTWNKGMVFRQVLTDLEGEGYEVQAFIIPACAFNAPHRRNRVWIIAHVNDTQGIGRQIQLGKHERPESGNVHASRNPDQDDSHTKGIRRRKGDKNGRRGRGGKKPAEEWSGFANSNWDELWTEVAARTCRVDDGLPARLDGFELSKPAHQEHRIKSLGNAIVPHVAAQIFATIKTTDV